MARRSDRALSWATGVTNKDLTQIKAVVSIGADGLRRSNHLSTRRPTRLATWVG